MGPSKRAVVAQRPSRCFSRFFVSLHTLAGALATAMPRPQRKASASAKYTVDPPSDDEGDDEVREVKAGVRKGKRRANGAADEGQDTDWKAAEPPKKRGRTNAGGGGRRRAKLESFQAMPMDVLVEIARHLDPLTLLHMSRANKMMRHVFARRASKPIWQIVRNNLGMPALEATDMTDMQLTALLFDKECRICGRGRSVITDYCLRMRWCKDCKKANLLPESKLVKELKQRYTLHPKLLQCALYTLDSPSGYNSKNRHYYCQAAVIQINKRLNELEQAVNDARRKPAPVKDAAKAALEAFIADKSTAARASFKDGQKLRLWERDYADRRKEADENARIARRSAVEERVRALGYEDADCNSWNWYDAYRLVDQPVRLTDDIWASISSRIIAAVDTSRRKRIVKAAEERLNQRYLNVKPLYSSLRSGQGLDYPAFSDFACFPSVTQLWMPEDALIPGTLDKTVKNAIAADVAKAKLIVKLGFACSLAKAYEEQGLTMEGGLAATLKTLPPTRIAADIKVTTEFGDTALTPYTNWWAPKQALNFEAFDDSIYDLEADVDALLRRFTSLFRCPNNCGKPLPYRQFLDHAENHRRTEGLVRYEEFKHLALVHEVLKETGLPNLVGSIATLDKSDWRFDCLNCKCSPGYWQVRNWTGAKNMTWSSFVHHISRDHIPQDPPNMRIFRKNERQPAAASASSAARS
ncbi:hypothetical protein NBRC10512_000526 [Rhodotorula toruloides]|uniref:RHTO0S02e09516g1_1 n=2 Tax=Rhodotorula toruloides TaxID=5286 RepID=A0A061AIR0_RHOTO|nr:cyclin-like F-box domain containing protein [Rhodotorula toruloides NP11]EMS23618.1 cyclin-like F-box domain containing protein [Rhodotorula toruloides NP11]CDR36993.1 RHTO0S02e09516g1_1 [Rhodotorula toruloides]